MNNKPTLAIIVGAAAVPFNENLGGYAVVGSIGKNAVVVKSRTIATLYAHRLNKLMGGPKRVTPC